MVWGQPASSKFAAIQLAAMRLLCRRLQGLASQGYVKKYVTNVGKRYLDGMQLALDVFAVRATEILGKLWLKHQKERVN